MQQLVDVQRVIVRDDLLDILLDFVDHRPAADAALDDDDVQTYKDVRKTVSRIVTLVTMNGGFDPETCHRE